MASTIPIGFRVEIVRIEVGISRTKLAKLCGRDRSTVTKWATLGVAPRDLEATAKALGVPVQRIYDARPQRSRRAEV